MVKLQCMPEFQYGTVAKEAEMTHPYLIAYIEQERRKRHFQFTLSSNCFHRLNELETDMNWVWISI